MEPGGVSFSGQLHDLYAANLFTRVANRILMRIASFKADGFRLLVKKLAEIPWELYLFSGMLPKVSVSAHKSRLYHTGAVAQHVLESIVNRLGPEISERPSGPQVFVRLVSDRCTVSIDSSGALLYKRGLKTFGGKAPLRETIAAGVLMLAGYRSGHVLLDPMCGAGSFSLEAAMISQHIPPGWYRDFAFMNWPSFQPRRWAHIKKQATEQIRSPEMPIVFASDQHKGSCRLLENKLASLGFSNTVSVRCQDFFCMTPSMLTARCVAGGKKPFERLVVLNPPYGHRLETRSLTADLYQRIEAKIVKDFKGWRFALIGPDYLLKSRFSISQRRTALFHGGLKLTLLTGRID